MRRTALLRQVGVVLLERLHEAAGFLERGDALGTKLVLTHVVASSGKGAVRRVGPAPAVPRGARSGRFGPHFFPGWILEI